MVNFILLVVIPRSICGARGKEQRNNILKMQETSSFGSTEMHYEVWGMGGGGSTVEKRSTQQSIATFTTFWQAWATQEPSSKKLKSFCQQECQTARLLDYVVAPNKVYLPGQISMVPVSLLRKCWHHLYKESLARIPVSNWGTGTGQSPGLLGTIPRPGLAVKLTLTLPRSLSRKRGRTDPS